MIIVHKSGFAIRHVATGFYLPEAPRASDAECSIDSYPRLFARRGLAKSSLTRWVEGRLKATYGPVGEHEGMVIIPGSERWIGDYEIVPITITITPNEVE